MWPLTSFGMADADLGPKKLDLAGPVKCFIKLFNKEYLIIEDELGI
jgi:hypothetical protein